ncbi:hypothetical protein BC936DRAFT_142367 [Jimgerdemannia flammicorona]|uniref:Uncharacterized protein n=1 Tax=Jimgerdemannia flammicorona TaxID=994334 RepID=A0A433A0N4_9FUNG|nr:hypothetical protein BC936DRAFT_142367 [Jimgerdemannia flammicorona]
MYRCGSFLRSVATCPRLLIISTSAPINPPGAATQIITDTFSISNTTESARPHLHTANSKPGTTSKIITTTRPSVIPAYELGTVEASWKLLTHKLAQHDVIIYKQAENARKMFKLLYLSAFLQLVFWGNLADLAQYFMVERLDNNTATTSTENPAPTENLSSPSDFQLAPKFQRLAIGAGFATVGIAAAGAMCMYPWR